MSIKNKATALLIVLAAVGYTQMAKAARLPYGCEKDSKFKTVEINMDLGRVIVSPYLNVGDTITTRTYAVSSSGDGITYRCGIPPQQLNFSAELINAGDEPIPHVYSTNITGIGMKLTYKTAGDYSITYPGTYKSTPAGKFSINGSTFTIELVKTAKIIGSGVITPREYSEYKGQDGAILISTKISGNGITIVAPSCQVKGNNDIHVDVKTENLSAFKGVGTKVGKSKVPFSMTCSIGTSVSESAYIYTSFSGNSPVGYDESKGVLKNEYSGSDAAKGIGFIMELNDTPVTFDKTYPVVELSDGLPKDVDIPLTVSYYQYDEDISAGKVYSTAVYNLTYD